MSTATPRIRIGISGWRYAPRRGMLRLRNARVALANFLASGPLALGEKLGPVLWQLPARHGFDPAELDAFLSLLPRTTAEASALGAAHDAKLDGRAFTDVGEDRPLRHALEVRSPSFVDDRFSDILRRHGVALVVADAAVRWPMFTEMTADFVYVRMHGADELYVSGYPDGPGRDVYVYFDNDVKVSAPFDALSLRDKLRTEQR